MLEANFSPETSRGASVTGAVQYDSGQRLRLRGLPTPQELAVEDELLSGDSVSVQVQFAYRGDSQSEPRPAGYDAAEGCWVCEVPDAYLTRASEVQVYVYVGYGADEDGKTRSKTMYTATFRPEGRPAPNDSVTPDQKNAWDALVAEVNLALSNVATATSGANAAAQTAQNAADNIGTAASDATAAAKAANEAAARLNGMNPVRSVNGFAPDANGAVDVKVSGAGDGQVAVFDASGKLVTSGRSFWAFTRATMSLSGTTLTITTVE